METTVKQAYQLHVMPAANKKHTWGKFVQWADKQEENRFTWTAISVAGHGCFFTILTVAIILMTGNHFIFWPFAITAMAACLVVNLAAMPLRIIIPVFVFSLLIDLAIIVLALSSGFNLEAAYR